MSFSTFTATRGSVHGQLKLARLMQMSEREVEARVRSIEGHSLFPRLVGMGVVAVNPANGARFAARRFAGRELRGSSDGLQQALDGRDELVSLIARIGEETFRDNFLGDEARTDEERASACAITAEQAASLRELVDRLYVHEEFQAGATSEAPETVYSSVAGIAVDSGRPVLAFFNREVWKGRYRVDEEKRDRLLASMPTEDAASARKLLIELEFIERRKSTLYRVLEHVIEAQTDYLISRDPSRRRPLAQRRVADQLGVDPSVLNRLISNKCVQLPWGLEAPLKVFMPSAKAVGRDLLHDLAVSQPELSDEGLRQEMLRRHGSKLSRRSIADYRKDLGLEAAGLRAGRNAGTR